MTLRSRMGERWGHVFHKRTYRIGPGKREKSSVWVCERCGYRHRWHAKLPRKECSLMVVESVLLS